jgi:predicted CXXCH cytochrome family protein
MSKFDLDTFVLDTIPEKLAGIRKPAVFMLLGLVILAAGFGWVLYAYPQQNMGPEQPIPFSHRLHAGIKGIDCRFCHPFVDKSAEAGLPEVGKCLFCHNYIITKHPEIRKIHDYYDSGTPIPWVKVFQLSDHVKFKHEPHVQFQGFDCTECHGPVETADRLPSAKFEMGFCVRCHQRNDGPMGCWLACHN